MEHRGFWLILAAGLCACATGPERAQPQRIELGYTDRRYFAIKHTEAWQAHEEPAQSTPYRATLSGQVCGVDVNYNASGKGPHLRMNGFLSPAPQGGPPILWASYLEVTETTPLGLEDRGRRIEGAVGSTGAASAQGIGAEAASPIHRVSFWLSRDRLQGQIGMRLFDLVASGDDYMGTVQFPRGLLRPDQPVQFIIHGREALWRLPTVAQTVILPLMLTCVDASSSDFSLPILEVDFTAMAAGGPPAPLSRESR
ncbi:MAG TPA: hypothetical protein VH877_23215 [Polyangia bacterium]|nr:hypothetical protein [Polyangia bacterium]